METETITLEYDETNPVAIHLIKVMIAAGAKVVAQENGANSTIEKIEEGLL